MTNWQQVKHQHELENDGEHILYDPRFWTAQVCLAGHVQNGGARVVADEKYCECGAETIHKCPSCHSNIKGAHRGYTMNKPPLGCLKCGKPYPWTQAVREGASRVIDETTLSVSEKEQAKTDLDSILRNTPGAESAAQRTRGWLGKTGEVARSTYLDFVVPLIAQTLAEIIKN